HAAASLAGQRRHVQDRRVVEKTHLAADAVVELLHEVGVRAFDEIPLVRDDDDAAAGAIDFAADRRVLIRRAFPRVDHQHDDAGVRDRFFGEGHADEFDLAAAPHAARAAHTGGVDDPAVTAGAAQPP